MAIFFHEEGVRTGLKKKRVLKAWMKEVILREKRIPGNINIVFTTDKKLGGMNQEFLSRDYYTDILTFDYSENEIISGDLYISLERVRENASKFKEPVERELMRVMIHGLLHILGYGDSKDEEKKNMRLAEDRYLNLIE